MKKKQQFTMLNCNISQVKEQEDGTLFLDWKPENFQNTSDSFLINQIQKITRELDIEIHSSNEIEKTYLISIETGKVSPERKPTLDKLLKDGFYIGEVKYNLIQFLSGSHHKAVKQFYTYSNILEKLQPRIDLKPLEHTIKPKRLTSNALISTDIYSVPYNLKKLNICIIPDNELSIPLPNMNGIVEYKDFTPEEELKKKEKAELDTEIKIMLETYKELKVVDYSKLIKVEGNASFITYKTPSRWLREDSRLVMLEEISTPKYYSISNKSGEKFITYTENQTIVANKELFDIAEWNTGYKLIDVTEISVNNFDGMGLVSKELGATFQEYLEEEQFITGYQLRLPQIKGFFPVVDIHSYFKSKGIKVIYDIFGQHHDTSTIDILACESVFKAKLDTSSGKAQWMWQNIEEYKNALVDNEYDSIGIANFPHPIIKNEYRSVTYQLLSSIYSLSEFELLALATPQGKLIANVLNVYRKEDIDWKDTSYIQIYLNNLLKNEEENDDDYVETAIKMLNYNKYMIFDKKFTSFLYNQIKHELEQMCIGRIKVKSNYLYVTTDVLGFLKYASKLSEPICCNKEGRDKIAGEKVEGFLGRYEFYTSGIIGEKVLVRNPLMKQSEIIENANFINISDPDVKYIKHLDNIIQAPMNTSAFQQAGGYDVDGDEFMLIHLDDNLKTANVDWLLSYEFEDRIVGLKENIKDHFNKKFPEKSIVNIDDLIKPNRTVQVNINDKAGAVGSDWNIDNIAEFIVSSDDKTGIITNINTTILNEINIIYLKDKAGEIKDRESATKLLKSLYLCNQIMKHKQGEMIDASKTGAIVDIPEIISRKFSKRPYFYKYKGEDEKKVAKPVSSMDKFCVKLENLIKVIDIILKNKTNDKVKNHQVTNLTSYIFNNSIPYASCEPFKAELEELKKKYSDEKNNIMLEKAKINSYSRSDSVKAARKINDKKWSDLYRKTIEEAKKICPDDEIRGNTLITITYEKSKDYDFAWVAAKDIFLDRLEINQTDSYLVSINSMGDIECLGKTYKSEFKEAIEKIKEKIKTDQTKLNNYKLTVCVYKSDCIEKKERFEKLKKGEYTNLVLVEEDGFIKLSVDGVNLGIDHKCYAAGNLKQRIGQAVIINKKNPPSASSINIYVDIN